MGKRNNKNSFSLETIKRLSLYLRNLKGLKEQGIDTVSSRKLTIFLNVTPDQFRKDLSFFGGFGKRGVGYNVERLTEEIENILGVNKERRIAIVGVGKLGTALLGFEGFSKFNIKITSAFDVSKDKVGKEKKGVKINHINDMRDIVKKNNIKLAYNPGITECSGGRKGIEKMLLASTLLILNLEEAKALTKEKIVTSIMKKLLNYGPKIVCITDGPNEITCSDGTWLYALRPNKTRIVERTGAGDAFSSGLLAGLIRNKDIEFSMQLGLANSESVIQYFGSRNKLLSWKEAALTIRKRRGRIRKMKL